MISTSDIIVPSHIGGAQKPRAILQRVSAAYFQFLPHTYQQAAFWLWTILVLVITVRVAVVKPTSGSVFPIYTLAAHDWLHGDPLYTLDFSRPCYRYHPAIAVSFIPWSMLPEKAAAILWRWLGVGLLLAGMLLWARRILKDYSPAQLGIYFAIVVPMALPSVNNAQANVHLMGLILLGLLAVREERWNCAAACIAAATLFKLYPVSIGLLVAVVFPRQFGRRFAAMLLAGSILPFFTQNPGYVFGQYQLWLEYLFGDDRHSAAIEQTTRDLHLLLRVWIGVPPEWVYQLMQIGSACGMALLCRNLRRAGVSTTNLLLIILNLSCVWMTLLGPSTESCTYTMLGPTIAGLWLIEANGQSRFRQITVVGALALLIAPVLALAFPEGKSLQLWGPQPLGALFALAVILAESRPVCSKTVAKDS